MNPASLDFICYRQDDFAFAFQFKDTAGEPFDMSLLGDITMRVFRARNEPNPLFNPVLTESDSNVTGGFTALQTTSLRPFKAWYEIRSVLFPDTPNERVITLVNGSIVTLDATEGQGVTDYISELTLDLASLSVQLTLGDSASIALQARNQAEGFASSANDSAQTATTQAGIATAGANTATGQAVIATNQANRSEDEANRAENEAQLAQSERLQVQNAVDADNSASIALQQVALIRNQALYKGDLLVTNTEPATPPTGFARIWLDGSQIKAKLSNGNNITLG